MILIADSGSTKTDWVLLDTNKEELFRVRTAGLNPSVFSKKKLIDFIIANKQLIDIKNEITKIYFYGAGCGTKEPVKILQNVLQNIFINADIIIYEDILAAVYASSKNKPAIVCILGTGSNSCFFNGKDIEKTTPSLGYTIMDEASGNYFGKKLLRDYFYNKMPSSISKEFEEQFNLDIDIIKKNLYRLPKPNMYLATFAKFMFNHKNSKYINKIIKKGFQSFFKYHILPYKKENTPIYFIGSIAFYFKGVLDTVAKDYNLNITNVIQRPMDNLVEYHRNNIN